MTAELTSHVTPAGAEWLASASAFPRSVRALWSARPTSASVLPCGTTFDVISAPALFGRELLARLGSVGPRSGPAALLRDRVMLFAQPGSAQRLSTLLDWEEWAGRRRNVPPLLCHGLGDTVTVPPVYASADRYASTPACAGQGNQESRGGQGHWLVAPAVRSPWLPGPQALLWSTLRAARPGEAPGRARRTRRQPRPDLGRSIFVPPEAGAKVYDVSRRR